MGLHVQYLLCILLVVKGAVAGGLPNVKSCSRQDTFLKHRYVYTYKYTAMTSSSFVGATDSASGSRITCTVKLSVARKCEIVMKLSDCDLSERQPGGANKYVTADQSDKFSRDLERNELYFQMNKGVVVDNTIVFEDEESLVNTNIKRGILSALQFQIRDSSDYDQPLLQTDVFGTCPTSYTFSPTEKRTVTTFRNLRDCHMVQIFRKQFNPFGSSIRRMVGGLIEHEITEGYYPFQSDITCSYEFNNQKRMRDVSCHQNHYFKPTAFHGEVVAAAMANVTQTLELKNVDFSKPSAPNPKKFSGLINSIKYDFGNTDTMETTVEQLQVSIEAFLIPFLAEDNEDVPRLYGVLVDQLRHASRDVIKAFMKEVFSCVGEKCPDAKKVQARQSVYIDSLETCGSDACIKGFIHCMKHKHVPSMVAARFMHSLTQLPPLTESVQADLLDYCKETGNTKCWLSLGAVLSVVDDKMEAAVVKKTDTLGQTISHIGEVLDSCAQDGGNIQNKDIVMFSKTLSNIGSKVSSQYYNQFIEEDLIINKVLQCLKSDSITKPARRALIKTISHWFEELGYKTPGPDFVETLFTFVEDVTMDATARGMAFSFLMKTTDKAVIKRLIDKLKSPDTDQFSKYMQSCLSTFRQNDFPGFKKFREAWEAYRKERYYFFRPDYSIGASKSFDLLRLFKLPLTEYFGFQLFADLIFDSGDRHFSSLTVSLNSVYKEERHNIMEFSLNIHGFSLLMDVISKRVNISPQDLAMLYKKATQMNGKEQKVFADFQQDIVDAVVDILDKVNHPGITDFDISVDLVTKGKEVGYMSLQDILSYVRMLKGSGQTKKPSQFEKLLKELMKSKLFPLFKCTEFLGITKVFPTGAGLPLDMTVRAIGMNKVYSTVQTNVAVFMAKRSPTLSASLQQYITFNFVMFGELTIPVGRYHNAGIRSEMPFGSERDLTIRATVGNKEQSPGRKFPKRLQIDLEPLSSIKDKENILYARGIHYLLQNTEKMAIGPDASIQRDVHHCISDQKQMALGRSFCAHLNFPAVSASQSHAYFPHSGPFDVTVEMSRVDNVGAYSFIFELMTEDSEKGPKSALSITHYGKGDTLDRAVHMEITRYHGGGLAIKSSAPEFGLTHEAVLRLGFFNFEIKEFIWLNGMPYLGYFIKADDSFNYNVTIPGASLDVEIGYKRRREDGKYITERFAIGNFYCTKDRPLLYLLHWDPMTVATQDFVTKIGYHHIKTYSREDGQTFIVLIGDQKITLEDKPGPGGPRHLLDRNWKLSFTLGEEEVTFDGSAVVKALANDCGENECPNFDINLNLESDQYNVVINGDATKNAEKAAVSATIECTNNQLQTSASNRVRRSIKSIFKKFKQIEKNTVDEIISIKKAILGEEDNSNIETAAVEKAPTLPDLIPRFPSIWDLKSWNAELDLTVMMPKDAGDRRDYDTNLKLNLPWSGGYVDLHQNLSIGHLKSFSYRDFGIWVSGSQEIMFSDLTGEPIILPTGEAMIVRINGDAHINRTRGKFFSLAVHHHSPAVEIKYEILFDWDAVSHHKPLFRVISEHSNTFMPILNHQYEEIFTYEPKHFVHNATFLHKMLTVHLETDIDTKARLLVQKGDVHIDIDIFEIDHGLDFVHKIHVTRRLTEFDTDLTFHSEKDKSFLINIKPTSPRTITIATQVRNKPNTDAVPLWSLDMTAKDVILREFTFKWYPALDELLVATLKDPWKYPLTPLYLFEARLALLKKTPYMEWTFPFTSVTVNAGLKQYMMPTLISSASKAANVVANFVPLKERMKLVNNQGPNIPPRLALTLQEIEKWKQTSGDGGPPMIRVLQGYMHKVVRGMITMTQYGSQMLAASPIAQSALKDRELIFGLSDVFAFTNGRRYPEAQHALMYLGPLFFGRRHLDSPRISSLAAVYGREHGPLYFKTWDNDVHEIPAKKADDCTYLLSADVMFRGFALVNSPSGVSLLTRQMSVSVNHDGTVYIDGSKQPSNEPVIESTAGDIKITQTDQTVEVQCKAGLNLVCYKTSNPVCVFNITGLLHVKNGTIGLFGTNDFDSFTDPRVPSGARAADTGTWLSQYAIGGPSHCHSSVEEPQDDKKTKRNNDLQWKCNRQIRKTTVRWCGNANILERACTAESDREGATLEDTCYIYHTAAGFCKPDTENMPDYCTSPVMSSDGSQDGSLEVVFVLPQKKSMLGGKTSAWEYVSDFVQADVPVALSNIRLAIVNFGIAVNTDKDSSFFSLDDYDTASDVVYTREDWFHDDVLLDAIHKATDLPSSPTAHKLLVVQMTKDQSISHVPNLEMLKKKLLKKGIVFNLILSENTNRSDIKDSLDIDELKQDNYIDLVLATDGTMWDIGQ